MEHVNWYFFRELETIDGNKVLIYPHVISSLTEYLPTVDNNMSETHVIIMEKNSNSFHRIKGTMEEVVEKLK